MHYSSGIVSYCVSLTCIWGTIKNTVEKQIKSQMSQCLNPDCLKQNPSGTKFCHKCGSKLLLVKRYRALHILGQGGFGRTFLAVDEYKPSQPRCVIKQFLPQAQGTNNVEKASELFAQEAVRLDQLGGHSQIPNLMAYFTQDERQYLIQEFIDGQNLAEELAANGTFNEQQIREFLKDLLSVLQFIHSNQVIHRDIKPENIIRRKSDKKLVLVDFGAAKFAANISRSVTGTVIGSAEYIAPEQAMGKPKFASDLYSLGVTCIHLLTQIPPFELFDVSEGDWIWRQYLVDNQISNQLGQILDRLIETATKRRYQSVEEVLAALKSQPLNKSQHQPSLPTISSPDSSSQSMRIAPNSSPPKTIIQLKSFQFEVVTVTVAVTLENSGLFGGKTTIKTDRRQGEAQYFRADLGSGVSLEMVSIPGGKFLMGSPKNEEGRNSNESPQHWVSVPPFFMGKYPVTQAQWQAVMSSNPSRFRGANRPVERVSWHDCLQFCEKLSEIIGRPCRLPSEAEWEYACRAGTTTPFHFGEILTTELANYNRNYGETTDVGSFPPNAFGLYDMHGNVWEWCADTWHSNYSEAPVDGSSWGARFDNQNYIRMLRGGSWNFNREFCRSASRGWYEPVILFNHLGLRIACGVH